MDSRVSCLRERQKPERRSREAFPKEVSEAINEIKERITTLESSVSDLIALTTKSIIDPHNTKTAPRKRTRMEAFGGDPYQYESPRGSNFAYISATAESHVTPPFSAYEAQTMIQEELTRAPGLSAKKQAAFQSALSSLKQSLNTSMIDHDPSSERNLEQDLENLSIPHITLIQWMLQSDDSGRSVCSNEFMPLTSRKTIARMAQDILNKPTNHSSPANLICVAAYAGYFLQEIVLSGHGDSTGLEEQLRLQALDYFSTARTTVSRILLQASPSLENLQGFLYGNMLAQEAGDFSAAWLLTEAASTMCLDMKLHKKGNTFENGPRDIAIEAYYCFAICYKNDKGLAMNLDRPAFLQDSIIEIDLLKPPTTTSVILDNFTIYLQLAQVQSCIATELRLANGASRRAALMSNLLAKMNQIWKLNTELQNQMKQIGDKYDSEMESAMVDFAYYSVKTVLFHSGAERLRPEYNQAYLDAARSALNAVQRARELSYSSQYNSAYMQNSFAHWTILHYPFTPFFVLFCNVISSRSTPDYNIMLQFVAYLEEAKEISISVAKLYKLCIPFSSLASSILSSEDCTTPLEPNNLSNSGKGMVPFNRNASSNGPIIRSQSPPPHPIVAYDSPALLQSEFNVTPQSIPSLGQDLNSDLCSNNFLDDFMNTQPMLQWLDSDFSALEEVWAAAGDTHY
ncbi:uncharacterized protein BP5553_09129 [Venustampulla echinocandica]|uniref:Xylanolytic transcriptional activator regulatory domain-containing protein n=1 Tax=Venustampulla echinocandica TaxID=2656787 RepID=A0A370TDX7_9HELO|nr:uncharacterized protein BP5553_09129 [Venustampulla echinocandica]RDL32673.1 hypothetical protein BP5553_09129 [Venustampulla echinocandica]